MIRGGTAVGIPIDGVTIGGTTPAAGTFTNLTVTGTLTAPAVSEVEGTQLLEFPPTRTTDAAATTGVIHGGDAYAQATVNTTGAALTLAGGIGRRFYTVVDYTSMAGKTATITVNGSATTLTEGVNFTAATSNNATATSLNTAVAAIAGLTSTAVAAVVYITPANATYSLTIATNAGAPMTATSGADGAAIVKGTNTNDSAAVGMVGEVTTATVAVGSKVTLSTGTSANVTSISVTPGDYDLFGAVDYSLVATTGTLYKSSYSATSATLATQAGGSGIGTDPLAIMPLITTTLTQTFTQVVPTTRLSLTATTTIFLVSNATFSVGSCYSYGTITARRIR